MRGDSPFFSATVMQKGLSCLCLTVLLSVTLPSLAQQEALQKLEEAPQAVADPLLETHVMKVAHELRCLVCQNESLAESNAPLAVDLRQQIREQIQAGKSDPDIRRFMVERFGEFVLYRPPLNMTTLLLWFGPALLFLLGLGWLYVSLRKNTVQAAPELTGEQQQQALALLEQTDSAEERQ